MGRKLILQHPALRKLVVAAKNLDEIPNNPGHLETLVSNARTMVRDAMDILTERDPAMQKILTAVVVLIESCSYRAEKINGEMHEVMEITDEYLHSWALREILSVVKRIRA